jgi:hypothetical protein
MGCFRRERRGRPDGESFVSISSALRILQVRKRAARMGRNPAIGEAIYIQGEQESGLPRGQGIEGDYLAERRHNRLILKQNFVVYAVRRD